MITVGIDNGTKHSAYAVFSDAILIDKGLLNLNPRECDGHKLDEIYKFYFKLFQRVQPDLICVEAAHYNPKRPTAYGPLCASIGAIRLAAMHCLEFEIELLEPTTVKKLFYGHGHATKDEVQKLVNMVYKIDEESQDICDAIAVGHAAHSLARRC